MRVTKKIVKPIVDDLKKLHKARPCPPPVTEQLPAQPAELDQDGGGGYNPDGTYPQT